jgi:peroxiredoxin Q/BCP
LQRALAESLHASGAENPNMLKVGDKAPDFAVTDDSGATVSLQDYRGKNLILYFYPKANTPG